MKKFLCYKCQTYKTEDQFHFIVTDDTPELMDKYHPDTVSAVISRENRNWKCKECDAAYLIEYHKNEDNRQRLNALGTAYAKKMMALRDAGDPKGLEWWKERQAYARKPNVKLKKKLYVEANKDKVSNTAKAWYKKMKALRDAGDPKGLEWYERKKELARFHYHENEKKGRGKEYRKANREKLIARSNAHYKKMAALRDAGDPKGLEWWKKEQAGARRRYELKKQR